MSRISSGQVEENLEALLQQINQETFIYDLLLAYGQPKSTVTLLQKGTYNKSKAPKTVLWKQKVYFEPLIGGEMHSRIDDLRTDEAVLKQTPRFIIVTDFQTLLAVDTKTQEGLDVPLAELHKYYDFFLPWAGMEKAQHVSENPADRKAAEKMAKLYDEIRKENTFETKADLHALNVFLCRVLFCFFAEDTEIFAKRSQFTHAIESNTNPDGSDLDMHLERIFQVMSLPDNAPERKQYPAFIQAFPYVNGGLFKDNFKAPKFNSKSWKLFVDSGKLNWSEINPDIFGSMMQAVVHTSERGSLGMHYTSVPNIMKVIEPLFLYDLREELERARGDKNKLERLHKRIKSIKIFDPACGSGNFLIISYKELRKLEMDLFRAMQDVSGQQTLAVPLSEIQLTQFHGIEIDDFASEVAILSLWLAEHQMNVKFKEEFGKTNPALPLGKGGKVLCDNALSRDWGEVCAGEDCEIYIISNPPYLGARNQNANQKADMANVFRGITGYNNLDYISCWLLKGADYINKSKAQLAMVSTNSICQGAQVGILWPNILKKQVEISFAHQSFKWANNAKKNAGVTCVIIGLRKISNKPKLIFNNGIVQTAQNINPYLLDASDIFIESRRSPLSNLPAVNYGSFALDDGFFTLNEEEKEKIISADPNSKKFIRPFIGAKELISGDNRYCIWVEEEAVSEALSCPPISERINKVRVWRAKSDREGTKKLANTPHRFAEIRQPSVQYLAFPTVSSERREYIPVSYLSPEIVASNQIYVIPNAEPLIFGLITSRMHMVWVRTVAGQLETRIRYSSSICYNNFPVPTLSAKQKETILSRVWNIISEREKYPELTMAQLYDPDKMPESLRDAHSQLDEVVEKCYRSKPFASDGERLAYLFKLYEEMNGDTQPSSTFEGTQNVMLTVVGPLLDSEDILPLGE